MDEGLIFWLIIMAVAVLQGVGRKKKQGGQPGQKPMGSPRPRPAQPRPRATLPGDVEGTSSVPSTRASAGSGESEEVGSSSEGMIPQDVWAEILGLARGEPQPPPPRRADPDALPPAEEEVVSRSFDEVPEERRSRVDRPRETKARAVPSSHLADAPLHQTRPEDFESRLAADRRPPPPEPEQGETPAARSRLFGGGSPGELRKAIILKEVLGPPVGLRED